MMEFQCESYAGVLEEIKPLLDLHWNEIASHKERFLLEPDWKKYEALASNGAMRIFTARENGMLIGYAIFFVTPHLHYKKMIVAKNDITYLHPDFRKGSAGFKLIKYARDKMLVEVDRIIFNVKVYKDFGKVLERLGFVPFETVYDLVK